DPREHPVELGHDVVEAAGAVVGEVHHVVRGGGHGTEVDVGRVDTGHPQVDGLGAGDAVQVEEGLPAVRARQFRGEQHGDRAGGQAGGPVADRGGHVRI